MNVSKCMAVMALSLAPVQACLHLTGYVGADFIGSMTAYDKGVQVCKGDIETGDKNIGKPSDEAKLL